MLNQFLNTLFPESCPVCREPSTDHKTAPICPECWRSILPYSGPQCRKCGLPLVSDVSITCGECIKDKPAFRLAWSFGLYDGVLKKAIHLLKYHKINRLSKPLSELILQIPIPRVDAVLPVPLYKKRLRQREFNQSALLAKHMAKKAGISLVTDCLIKTRDTAPQVGLSAGERRKNVRKAFRIQNKKRIQGKSVLLIDDVITTGATVRECSSVLKKSGPEDVYAIALAHTVMD
ncbi:MAG TPA: ComF family protein [Nitrospirae bacterium]|nr:ComF family protein [Nitrospirota bacterium]